MVKCDASTVEMVCSDRIHDYRKQASDQHSSADRSFLWRQVCRFNQYQINSRLQCVLVKSCL